MNWSPLAQKKKSFSCNELENLQNNGVLSISQIVAPDCGTSPSLATPNEGLFQLMKRCTSENRVHHLEGILLPVQRLYSHCKSPDSTLEPIHSKQPSLDSLETMSPSVTPSVQRLEEISDVNERLRSVATAEPSSLKPPQSVSGHLPSVNEARSQQHRQQGSTVNAKAALAEAGSSYGAKLEQPQRPSQNSSASLNDHAPSSSIVDWHDHNPQPVAKVDKLQNVGNVGPQHTKRSSGRVSASGVKSDSHAPSRQQQVGSAQPGCRSIMSGSAGPDEDLRTNGSTPSQGGASTSSSLVLVGGSKKSAEYYRSKTTDLSCLPSYSTGSSDDDCDEATRKLTAAFPHLRHNTVSIHERKHSWGIPGVFSGVQHQFQQQPQQRSLMIASEPSTPLGSSRHSVQSSGDGHALTPEEAEAIERRRLSRSNYHLTSGQAAVELFLRLNHARQTLDFVKRQAGVFSSLDRAKMDIWEALDSSNELREYEAALMAGSLQLDPDMPMKEHALQTAELCRLAYPDTDWLHLVGLIHGLGKLLAHQKFGTQPQWATCGESFPLGCRFDGNISGAQFFTANPDRRRRLYNTPLGIYQSACGLQNVFMSWSAAEYLYLMLLLNDTALPHEALFIIRYQKFYSLTKPQSAAYRQLLSPEDMQLLPLLASFQKLCTYKRVAFPQGNVLSPEEQYAYYNGLIGKYIGIRKLSW